MAETQAEPRAVQIVTTPDVMKFIESCLELRGMYLYPVPVEDDLSTWAVGVRV